MRFLVAFARFWWDFVVGDDWRIAAGVTLALGLGAVLVAATSLPGGVVAALVAGAIFATAIGSILWSARHATGP